LVLGIQTFFTSSVIWGVIGPKHFFESGTSYHATLYGFLFGLLIPVPFYFLAKRFPRSIWRYVNFPALLYGAINLSPYNLNYIWAPTIVGFVFNYYIKRRYLAWWEKYAYVLTSSFGAAVAISAIIIFFAVEYHPVSINWWGNTVSSAGCDAAGCPLYTVPDTGIPAIH
jgi:OPT oligopeptide transporter protein